MKKILYILIPTIAIVIILLFIFGRNDERKINLGQGYYYIPFQEITFDVTSFGGNGIYVYKNNCKVPIIFPDIISYKYDSTYILVKQKFNFLQTKSLLETMLFLPNTYFKYDKDFVFLEESYSDSVSNKNDTIQMEEFITNIMNHDKYIMKMVANDENYYIINKSNNKIIGPLKYEIFKKLKLEMRIQIDL